MSIKQNGLYNITDPRHDYCLYCGCSYSEYCRKSFPEEEGGCSGDCELASDADKETLRLRALEGVG